MRRLLAIALVLSACKAKPPPGPAVLEGRPSPTGKGTHAVESLATGGDQFCALYTNGTVACWGDTARTALDLTGSPDSPARVPDIRGAVQLALGACHGCALGSDGKLACWGYRVLPRKDTDEGELVMLRGCVEAARVFAARPVPVPQVPKLRLLATSSDSAWTCGVSSDDQLHCWGVWGTDALAMTHQPPSAADGTPPLAGTTELDYGAFPCARGPGDRVACWPKKPGAPSASAPAAPVIAMASAWGLDERCYALRTGALQCRGGGGALDVPGETAATGVAMAVPEVCATHADGSIACFTYDLRPGASRAEPIARKLRGPVRSLVGGRDTLCALLADDGVVCWRAGTTETREIRLPP